MNINHGIEIDLKVDLTTWNRITDVRIESARLWNRMVKLHHRFRKRNKPWPSESQFEKHFKQKFNLHSSTVQALIQKFFANIQTTQTLKKNGNKSARYSYKLKKFTNPIWKNHTFKIKNNKIILSLGMDCKIRKYRKPIILKIPNLPNGKVVQVELGYNKLFLIIQNEIELNKTKQEKIAAVDLGVIHLGVVTDGIESLAIVGRGLRSLNQGVNKNIAAINFLQSKYEKHSRKYNKLQKRKRKILTKKHNQKKDILHKSANKIVKFCEEKEITKLVVGDIADINRNSAKASKKKNNKRRIGRRLSQELGCVGLGVLTNYLKYKLKEKGIEVEKYNESYTSQTCPSCGLRNKPQGRIYICKKFKYKGIRDEVGAMNLLNKYKNNGEIKPQEIIPKDKIKYLRPIRLCNRKNKDIIERSRATGTSRIFIHARSADI